MDVHTALIDTTVITPGMHIRTSDLERLCGTHDPRVVEFGCFLLHSSEADAALAIRRAIDGMFDDPVIRAMQEETAQCIRGVAVAALDLELSQCILSSMDQFWGPSEPG